MYGSNIKLSRGKLKIVKIFFYEYDFSAYKNQTEIRTTFKKVVTRTAHPSNCAKSNSSIIFTSFLS